MIFSFFFTFIDLESLSLQHDFGDFTAIIFCQILAFNIQSVKGNSKLDVIFDILVNI